MPVLLTAGLFYLLSLAAFLWIAVYNRYPVVYPDTGAYIHAGCSGTVPVDRPVIYGLFVRHISMLRSLWFVAVVQGLTAVFLVVQTMKLARVENKPFTLFVTCLLVSVCTTCGYYIGQIMPDIFSAFMWWSLGLILLSEKRPVPASILLYIILIFSSITHFSNLLGLILFSAGALLVFLISGNVKHAKKLWIIPVISLLAVFAVNFIAEKKIFVSKCPNVFFTAKLCSTGILKTYLSGTCPQENYKICSYRDALPNTLEGFLWGPESIIEKARTADHLDYDNECISLEGECRKINIAALSDRHNLRTFIKTWLSAILIQSYNFDADILPPLTEGSGFDAMMKWHYKDEFKAHRNSRQSQGTMNFSVMNRVQQVVMIVTILYFLTRLVVILKTRSRFPDIMLLTGIIFIGFVVNIFICEFFSNPVGRYSGRIIWLFPVLAFRIRNKSCGAGINGRPLQE
ncbi:MAG: hypothetical protein WCK34_08030, partial [Bacteroidota bacterium]